MRSLPNVKIFAPCDAVEAKKATLAAAKIWGPVYLRLSREKTPIMTAEATPFTPGKAEIFWQPPAGKKPQVAIIACGPLLYSALLAARDLEQNDIYALILNNHTIKPIDEKKIIEIAEKCGTVITIEEHQVSGGLGSAVAEVLAKNHPVPMEFIGMQNIFGESGQSEELLEKYGMGVKDIKLAVKKAIKRK